MYMFSHNLTTRHNFCDFLFTSLDYLALLKWVQLLKERICSKWSKFFPLKVDPNYKGIKKKAKLLPLKAYPFTLCVISQRKQQFGRCEKEVLDQLLYLDGLISLLCSHKNSMGLCVSPLLLLSQRRHYSTY